MTKYIGTEHFSHDEDSSCSGILITNLGTPDEATPSAVRRYLAEFLSDPRIVEAPRLIWWFALHGVILRIRPKPVAKKYQHVWTDEGSPLLTISQQQRALLQQAISPHFKGKVKVELAMRYGNPSIKDALLNLKKSGAQRILVLPLYPQYSATTTASTFDAIADELKTWRWLPEFRFIQHYHDHEAYIQALVNSISNFQNKNGQPEKLLFSFHGLPQKYLDQGDPYFCECHKTARLVAERMGLKKDQWILAFQSLFGREEWLKPYAKNTLINWAKEGVKNVQVICPGFSADCLETLEEIKVENRDYFLNAGGEKYEYIPALNDNAEHIGMMGQLIKQHASDWLEIENRNTIKN
jgi:ferrochelatase